MTLPAPLMTEAQGKAIKDSIDNLAAVIRIGKGEVNPKTFAEVQAYIRSGLGTKIFSIGDRFEVERAKTIDAAVTGSTGITAASVAFETFLNKIGKSQSGVYEFVYDGRVWKYGADDVILSAYGIAATGTPVSGDKIVITEATDVIVFEIIGIDHDTPKDSQFTHSITIQMVDCYTTYQFDAQEAMYYAPDGLAAGTYYFTLLAGWDVDYGGGKNIQFTLANAVPAGGQIMYLWNYHVQAVGASIITYSGSSSTAAIETVTTTEGTGGTFLGTCDGASENVNHAHKLRYGNSNWTQSAIRQWANSGKVRGSWWSAQNNFDRPPNYLANSDGFLYGLSKDFVNVVGVVRKATQLNSVTDGSGSATNDEKFFLLGREEVYGGSYQPAYPEGTPYEKYQNYSDLSAAGTGADSNRIKFYNGNAAYQFLRTPYPGIAYNPCSVNPTGIVSHGGNATNGSYGEALACVIY